MNYSLREYWGWNPGPAHWLRDFLRGLGTDICQSFPSSSGLKPERFEAGFHIQHGMEKKGKRKFFSNYSGTFQVQSRYNIMEMIHLMLPML
jgi:hypothetical protein